MRMIFSGRAQRPWGASGGEAVAGLALPVPDARRPDRLLGCHLGVSL